MAATDRITPIDESEVAVNESADSEHPEPTRAVWRHLPDERRALTHHFSIAGQEGYLTVGVYEDGLPGEIFITMAKQGSTISGLMDAFATWSRLPCSTACHCACFATNSATCALSPAVGLEVQRSATPSRYGLHREVARTPVLDG